MNPNNPDPNNPNSPAGGSSTTPDLSSVLPASPAGTPTDPATQSVPQMDTSSPPVTAPPNPIIPSTTPMPDPLAPPPPIPPVWTPPPPAEPPTSDFNPPVTAPPPEPAPSLGTGSPTWPPVETTPPSSLDNPLNAPLQPPSIDSGLTPLPAAPERATSWQPENPETYTPPQPQETTPTDLSHLVDNSPQQEIPANYTTPVTQPETLVAPPNGGEVVTPTVPMEGGHGGIPKWVIGVGAALLLAVVGASAYFILGIGRPTETTSLPAVEESQQLSTPPTPLPTPIATPQTATSSGFGNLGASPSPAATSAADLIRQRQGR